MRNLLKKSSKYSKRINYDALKGLFDEGRVEEDKDGSLYRLSDAEKSDGEMMLVDEDARTEQTFSSQAVLRKPSEDRAADGEFADMDDDDAESDKGEDYGSWEDTFEQEAF